MEAGKGSQGRESPGWETAPPQPALGLCVYLLPFRTSSFQSLPEQTVWPPCPCPVFGHSRPFLTCAFAHAVPSLESPSHTSSPCKRLLFKPSSNAQFEPCKLLREAFSSMHLAAPSVLPEHCSFSHCTYNRIQSAVHASASRSPPHPETTIKAAPVTPSSQSCRGCT